MTEAAARISEMPDLRLRIKKEMSRVIVGQEKLLDFVLIGFLAGGHLLLEGVPGLAKTLLVRTLGAVTSLKFSRIQFTPDLMPADITGTDIIDLDRATGGKVSRFMSGPLFANIILADEINRTPPKTQSALLQAMQEKEVTVGNRTYPLQEPFYVLATQNPIEHEGTYPLPEAQLDRFMMKLIVNYPDDLDEEAEVISRFTRRAEFGEPEPIIDRDAILQACRAVLQVAVPETLVRYAAKLVRVTRPNESEAPSDVREYVEWGAGPRAAEHLIRAAQAKAAISGRPTISAADIQELLIPVLRHRLVLNYKSYADRVWPRDILKQIKEKIEL